MITKPFTFGSKDTYLQFRKEWTAEYMQISQDIRNARNSIKNVQKEGGQAGFQLYIAQRTGIRRANELLELLKEAKQEAQKQYMEQKESCNVCN